MNKPKYALGIDIGGTKIAAGLVNAQGKIASYQTIPTQAARGGPSVLKRINQLIKPILNSARTKKQTVIGIGVDCPGAIDPIKGRPLAPTPHIPKWKGLPIKQELNRIFHLPVWVENDVNAIALAEKKWGSGKQTRNIFCLTIGTGIGGGIIINNQLHRGHYCYAGEIGHLMVDPNGPQCNCGRWGCLEALAGGPAIVRRTKALIKRSFIKTRLSRIIKNNPQSLNPTTIFQAASQGDRIAQRILNETAHYIGLALSYVINLLDPELIIVGGGVARAGKILIPPIQKTISQHIIPSPIRQIKIVPAHLSDKTGVLGGAALVFEATSIPTA